MHPGTQPVNTERACPATHASLSQLVRLHPTRALRPLNNWDFAPFGDFAGLAQQYHVFIMAIPDTDNFFAILSCVSRNPGGPPQKKRHRRYRGRCRMATILSEGSTIQIFFNPSPKAYHIPVKIRDPIYINHDFLILIPLRGLRSLRGTSPPKNRDFGTTY